MAKFVTLEQTCESYPEQYLARIWSSHIIGYIRLRWGHLSCDYLTTGNLEGDRIRVVDHIFNENPDDEYKGEFDSDEERTFWLDKCKKALLNKYRELKKK